MIEEASAVRKRTRLVVQKGNIFIALRTEDVALIYTENKIVFIIDRVEKKYISNSKLNELEQELDPAIFFRATRQHIININFIKSFRAFERVKLSVDLNLPNVDPKIIVSQLTTPLFKRWIYEEV